MYGNSQQRRGWALRLMKMFWERKPKINMCSVCGENEEKMILFLTNSNQVENVVKVSQAALGKVFFWGDFFFYFIQKQRLLQVNEILRLIYLICLCCGGNSRCALIWKQSILHSLVLIKQPAGCFITLSQRAAENLQFKVFPLLMNSVSTARPLARNLPGESDKNITTQIYYYLPALMCQMFVLGTNLMRTGTLQSFYTSGSVHSSQRVLLSLLSLWKQLYNIF